MLSPLEQILFALAVVISIGLTGVGVRRIVRVIARGRGAPDWAGVPRRLAAALTRTIALAPTWRARFWTSLFHALVAWAFMFYLLVNVGDVVTGYAPQGFVFLGEGAFGDAYRLAADIVSVAGLIGIVALILRRQVLRSASLGFRANTLLHPKARAGIQRDSAIVAGFIFLHVGARFVGASLHVAQSGGDAWQPFASAVSRMWVGMSPSALAVAQHAAWWLGLGLILAFFPYFPYSKHIHLFFAPVNFLLKPERPSIGQLDPLAFDDPQAEQFGASRLEDLSWGSLVDAYACIMCNRCQDACPAYATGKVLSPAALEINKRYFVNAEGSRLARGEASSQTLLEFAIPPEAVWACTACGACVDICPVGNDPMRDILEIRRSLVLSENRFPEQLQAAFRGMERAANPWNIGPEKRLEWAAGLEVATIEQNPDAEVLWWVGCAPATDARAQQTARTMVRILRAAGVSFAVLGRGESCTGDPARRAGNDYLFHELAKANVQALNRAAPKRILTTCPHCLHTLKNEYPAYGGRFDVVHHTQLIQELIDAGRLKVATEGASDGVTYHDPCYLGRHNGVFDPPRRVLDAAGVTLTEMERIRSGSFCCGAGGAQMWKVEEAGRERVSANRVREAMATGAGTLAVGCPFCMIMLRDAARAEGDRIAVKDVAEIVAERIVDSEQ
ncbi:MAG: (Fe-S)-binding protein [Anaerolineales bacterium]